MKLFKWFLKIFSKKEKKKEESKVEPPKEKKEIEEQIVIKETSFQRDLKKILNEKEKIIKEQEENKLQIIPSDTPNLKVIRLNKELFCFDDEGFKLFQEEFNKEPYSMGIEPCIYRNGKKVYYLIRENKNTGKKQYFHTWLMRKEIEDFCLEYNLKINDVIVHHKNINPSMNERNNLQVITIQEHDIIHNRI